MADEFGKGAMTQNDIVTGIKFQGEHCRRNDAPITARIVDAQLSLMESDTQCGQRIANWPGIPLEDALPLRLAGGFHHLRLTGDDFRLEPVYRGEITDQAEVDAIILAVTRDHDARLLPWLDGPPQTNEAARSASFMLALKWLSNQYGPRFEINELGASAGINTMMERYHYDLGGATAGPADSPVQIKPEWRGATPPDAPVDIVAIQGCDQAPVDLTDPDAALRLKSYVWPEMTERLARMDAAIALAEQQKPQLVRADAADWVVERLSAPQEPGVMRTIQHSIVWQYIPEARRQIIREAMAEHGQKATAERPLAWISLETNRETFRHELYVTCWPGDGQPQMLGQAHAHAAWVESYV